MKVLVKNITNKGFNSSKHSFKKYETKECYFTDEVIAGQQIGDYKVWEEFLRLQDRGLLQITKVPSAGVLDAPTLNGLTVAQIIAASSVSTLEGVGWEKVQATTASYAITKPASGVGLDLHIEVGGSLATLNSTSWPVPASGVDQLRIRNFSGSAKTLTAGTGWTIVTADGDPVTSGSYSIPDDKAVEITLDPDGFAQVVPWGGEVSQATLDAGLALKAPLASPTLTGTVIADGTVRLGDGQNVGDSGSAIANATTVFPNIAATATSTIATTDIALRASRPGTTGTKWGNTMDVVIGSHTAGINASTQVDFRLNNGGVNTPDTTVLSLKSNGDVLANGSAVVRQADINNTLTSTSTTVPLSAAQGKTLQDEKAPLASPSFTGTPVLNGVPHIAGDPKIGSNAAHTQRSYSDITGAAMLMVPATGTATSTITTSDVAARYVKPGTAGTKSNSVMDIVVGSHTAGVNSNTQVDFRLGNAAVNTPDATVLSLKSDGAVLANGLQVTSLATTGTPVMNGTAALGTATTAAHSDHVHGSDTSRAPAAFNGVRVTRTTDQAITTTTGTAIEWNSEVYDTTTYHDNTTNTARLTALAAGYYRIGCKVQWATNATGERSIGWRISAGNTDWTVDHAADATADTAQSFSTDVYMTAGQYVEFMSYHTSGANLNILGSKSYATMSYLGS